MPGHRKRLDEEPDVSIRRALLLSLGEFGEKVFSPEDDKALLPKLQDIYRTDDRSWSACGGGMAVADLEARGVAETGERGVGEGQAAARKAAERHQADVGEGQRENAAAVVRQRPGSNDGGDSRPGGVPDGIAAYGSGQAGHRDCSTRCGSVGRSPSPPSR